MNMFNAFVRLQKSPNTKTAYTIEVYRGNYPLFETLDKFYLKDDKADYIKSHSQRKPTYKLVANKGYEHLSGMFMLPNRVWGYGDVKTSKSDLLIFCLNEDLSTIEIFIAIGKSNQFNIILNLITNGNLDDEIMFWRNDK